LPQWIRLPTLFHRLAPRGGRRLDRGRYRTLFTSGRSWPRAARRLLQSKRSASTTCGSRNPDSLGRPALDGSVSRFTHPLPRARLRPMPARLAPRRHRSRSPVAARRAAFTRTVYLGVGHGLTQEPRRRTGAEDSRVRGRLVLDDPEIAAPATLHDNRLSWRLRPNPLGSNTPCRCRSRRPR